MGLRSAAAEASPMAQLLWDIVTKEEEEEKKKTNLPKRNLRDIGHNIRENAFLFDCVVRFVSAMFTGSKFNNELSWVQLKPPYQHASDLRVRLDLLLDIPMCRA